MIHKRPCDNERVYEVACKHPRHWNNTDHFDPVVDLVPTNSCYPKPFASGIDGSGKSHADGGFLDESINKTSSGSVNEFEAGTSGLSSHFWWADGDFIRCDLDLDAPINLSLFPEFFSSMDQLKAFIGSDGLCSSPVDCDSQELVSVGPEYQAEIPEWDPQGNLSDNVDGLHEKRLMGTCVIPMPDSGAFSDECCESCECRSECNCPDRGSIRCVRQHVIEARTNLRTNLGDNTFEALGFSNMGESASEKWTDEEEQAFYEVVRLNPATSSKNFWDQLSNVFPSRTKKDLVSYYFNVFMLRIRMEQNRCVPLNIDSDDDEWQTVEERVGERDEGSELGSLTSQDAEDDGGDTDHMLGEDLEDSIQNHDSDNKNCQLMGGKTSVIGDDYDNQTESCASYESQDDNTDRRQPTDE